jgi:hypothetical protein
MSIHTAFRLGPIFVGLLALAAPLMARAAAGQAPIHGFNGTIALQGSVDRFYPDLNTLLVKTSDGIEHIVHLTEDTEVHGGSKSLDSLRPGTTVVVHYTVKGIQTSADEIDRIGPDGLKVNEGIVTSVDRAKKRITIKFADGTTETLRLTRHAADDSEGHMRSGNRVVVYYSDESGQRIAHYFKPAGR